MGCRRYLPTRAHTELSVYELLPAAESVPILVVGFPQAGYARFLVAAHCIEIGHEALAVVAADCSVVHRACPLMHLLCLDPIPC